MVVHGKALLLAENRAFRNSSRSAIERLANDPHDTIPGLRRRYYYRGAFVLLEHLSARGLGLNVKRLRRRGEYDHADKLITAFNATRAAP